MNDYKLAYEYARKACEDYVQLATKVSSSIHHQKVDTKSFWASVLFAKFCVTSVSLVQLLPGNLIFPSAFDNWDAPSVATLSRNLIENYHTLFYLCIEKVSEQEWQCRLQLFNLHDCITRKKLFTDLGTEAEMLANFEQQANELREQLKLNPFFLGFSDSERKKWLKGDHAFYLTREDIEQRFSPGVSHFKAMYRLLSSQAHTFPMSFYRTIEQRRGTGVKTDAELDYISMAVEYIIQYLQLATRQMLELYPNAQKKLNNQQILLMEQTFVHYDDLDPSQASNPRVEIK
jgi:hypothetical protein